MAAPVVVDLYARVSTAEQAAEGYSLAEQERRLRAFADAQGWTVNACYIDGGYSGAKLDRPGIKSIIADVQARKISKVITYKLDRLSRSQKDTLYLIEDVFTPAGVDYVSMTEPFDTGSPFGRATVGVLSIFAQLEREQIAERMTLGRIASAQQGNWRGGSGVPIGYRYLPKTATEPGRLVVDAYEAGVVRDVFAQFLAGRTFHAIYDYCRQNYTTSYGSFAGGGAALIPAMLSNRAYIGDIKYAGKWYAGKHEPIIDAATFERAQALLADYRATLDEHKRRPFQTGHLLSGFLFCGECGARWCFHSCSYKNKAGERIVYGTYTCYTKNAHKSQRRADRCSIPVWSASELEALVWAQVLALRFEDLAPDDDADALQLQTLEDHISDIERQQGRLVDLYSVGTIPLDVVQERSAALQQDREKTLQLADNIRARRTRPPDDVLRDALASVQAIHDGGDIDAQRDLLRLLIKRITLNPGREVVIDWNV